MLTRCSWVNDKNPIYIQYHDNEWGVVVHDDNRHFEMLTLEGAQAGLSWETVLNRRENYRKEFHDFDPKTVSVLSDDELNDILQNANIIKNRLKVFSVRKNARVFCDIQQQFRSFDAYIWAFVNHKTIYNNFEKLSDMPTQTAVSVAIAKDLKKRGMTFVGATIIYAYMQAIGMVNDHMTDCFLHHSNDRQKIL